MNEKELEVYRKIFCKGLGSYGTCGTIHECSRSEECFMETVRLHFYESGRKNGLTDKQLQETWIYFCKKQRLKVDSNGNLLQHK